MTFCPRQTKVRFFVRCNRHVVHTPVTGFRANTSSVALYPRNIAGILIYASANALYFALLTELRHTGPQALAEFTDKLDFCKEFCTQVHADATVFDNKEFRGLIFSIY